MPKAGLCCPGCYNFFVGKYRTAILWLLLSVEGEERRSEWPNTTNLRDWDLLQFLRWLLLSRLGYRSVSVLLEAGADETGRDWGERLARDIIGVNTLGRDGVGQRRRDRGE